MPRPVMWQLHEKIHYLHVRRSDSLWNKYICNILNVNIHVTLPVIWERIKLYVQKDLCVFCVYDFERIDFSSHLLFPKIMKNIH